MHLSPAVLGFVRSIMSVVIFSVVMAVLSYLADATHLSGVVNGGLAVLIASVAGMIEHQMEANGSGALFGTVTSR